MASVRHARINQVFVDHFPVYNPDRVTKHSGLASNAFTLVLYKDGTIVTPGTVPSTIAEIGSSGEYSITFTSGFPQVALWEYDISNTFNQDVWYAQAEVTTPPRERTVMSLEYAIGTDILTCNVWYEIDGQQVASIQSVSVSIYNSAGTLQYTITSSSPDAHGVMSVTKVAPGFVADTLYYAIGTITLTDGRTIQTAKGIQSVSA